MTIMLLWIASGNFSSATKIIGTKNNKEHNEIYVQIKKPIATEKIKQIELYGVTSYSRQVNLRAEIFGKVVAVKSKEGTNVKKGDILLQIEIRDRHAKLLEAESNAKEKKIAFEAAKELEEQGYQAKTGLAKAAAELEKAKAILIQAQIDMDNINIKAPFDGYLESILVENGTYIGPNVRVGQGSFNDGDTIATVVDRSPMLAIGYVSEKYISKIKIGTIASIELISGKEVKGEISYISSIADSITRTFRVEITIDNEKDINYKSGVTALIRIPIAKEKVHNIRPSALVLGKNGELGIKILVANNISEKNNEKQDKIIKGTVKFQEINIYDTDSKYIYASDLPNNINIITFGHGFVHDGQENVIGEINRQEINNIEHTNNAVTK